MRVVLYLSALITVIAFLTNAIAVGLPYWLYTKSPQEAYQGLWQRCEAQSSLRSNSRMDCQLITLPPEMLDAVRVMMLFGSIAYGFSCICVFYYIFSRDEKTSLINAATILVGLGGMFCMIAVVTYGAMYPRLLRAKNLSLHAGYGMAVVSCILGFVNIFIYCLAKARGDVD